ncbi:sulfatase-like hydrolase/transferase [Niabella drilacis]|uniref:Arylsulfatase A n=1 Tax=Niabella drilacis (strain DSM 25811 / CCM 8410 / CCUG 62505 / LMG 26954 / E90) TaxID=1285928 RepID=A0A1G6RI24_NIADE|nr:sulfatase-like hydrolase/transferase [Niabella drilacis]SDD04101.1 Arylsulfatase A [Niabella drilacis]
MKKSDCRKFLPVVMICCCWPVLMQARQPESAAKEALPNILWLTSEDNSPLLGCYGDAMATTPNLDRLAGEGFLYTHAYANAPVCAPSRNTIITGVYACAAGNDGMRSYYPKSDMVRLLPEYLRERGYYCTNNSKQDYNIADVKKDLWNESSNTAHYKNRRPGQPFFAVFNTLISHESCLHKPDSGRPKHDPDKVKLPPYQPDTRAIRTDWARYYDYIEKMDAWVGEKLQELEAAGLAENTIVIYYGDHGGVLPRSKRYVYETGTRIPFIIRIPEQFKKLYPAATAGSKVNRLVSLVDLVPTLLSICNIPVPSYLQGHAFLGKQKSPDPQYAYMFRGRMDERIDMSRAVRDHRYRYIRNYMPYRIYAQHIDYLWKAAAMRSWEEEYWQGRCNEVQSRFFRAKPVEELYDTEKDPWEVRNLADDPAFKNVLLRMRTENTRWMKEIKDAGFIPEGMIKAITKGMTVYDYMRSGAQPMDQLIAVSDLAGFATIKDIPGLSKYLSDPDMLLRYWAANGLLQLGEKARGALPALKRSLTDASPDVAITVAETLYRLGDKKASEPVLLVALNNPDIMVQVHALNAIDNSCVRNGQVRKAVTALAGEPAAKKNEYISNITKWILNKP